MDKGKDKNMPPATTVQNEKEKNESGKKYNFYRKPSVKKKAPEVKQTLTSYKRMLKANPLLKYEIEGKDLSLLNKQFLSSSIQNKANLLDKIQSDKQSLQPNFNNGKPLVSSLQRSKSLKNPPKFQPKHVMKGAGTIISGNKPKTTTNTNSVDISRQSHVDFNTSTSRFLCSTKLEATSSKVQKGKSALTRPRTNLKPANSTSSTTQDNCVSSSGNSTESRSRNNEKKCKPLRRSLSAQHFDRKKGVKKIEPQKCFSRVELTQSLDNVSMLKPAASLQDISPIPEKSRESSMIFKTPSAYERRSVARFTPRSTINTTKSLHHPATPLPTLSDLQKRLNDWLKSRGKNPRLFRHLKCFGGQDDQKTEVIDEENKENIEVNQDLDKGSYEELKIDVNNKDGVKNGKDEKPIIVNEENAEHIARAALDDLQKLIQEGYSRPQCEGWLELIRQKYRRLEEEPQYWECRAAIEQSRGNISNAVECYRTAIVQGAEIQAVDESLDILLQKFSLLNITTDNIESEKSIRERTRIVQDARNVFKSSIIQFAIQERKLKKNVKEEEQRKLVATPVRRSTRLSRTAYTSTPGIKICSSLLELDTSDRDVIDFKKNKALF